MTARALSRIRRRLGIFVYAVLTRPLAAERPPLPAGIELRLLSAGEAIAACAEPAFDLTERTVRAAIDRNEACVGAFDRGTLVGYAWFAREATAHVGGIWMDFDRRAVYIYRALVRQEHRGRGIAPALYRFTDPLFLAEGRQSAIICIDTSNRASLHAAEHSGSSVKGLAGYFKMGTIFVPLRSHGARRVGFRFYLPSRGTPTEVQ